MREYTHTHTHTHTDILKEIRGITLVALVVTIVVLIILAVISINIVFGEEGILERARQSQKHMANAQVEEEIEIARYTNEIEKNITNSRNYSETEVKELLADYQKLRSDTFINVPLTSIGTNNSVTTEFTAPTDGYYIIGTNLSSENYAYTQCVIKHYLSNKTTLIEQVNTGGAYYMSSNGRSIYMKEGEYITITQQKNITVHFSRFWYAEGCVPEE